MDTKSSRDRARQEEWRACEPDLRAVIEVEAPRQWSQADEGRLDRLPLEWRERLDSLAAEVRREAEDPESWRADADDVTRFAHGWSAKVRVMADVLGYLQRQIRQDIGCSEGSETLSSMALVEMAMRHLRLELGHIGSTEGREDEEENRCRVFRALTMLNSRFDDLQMRRFRALRAAEIAVEYAVPLDDASIDESVARVRQLHLEEYPGEPFDGEVEERQRRWFRVELPMQRSIMARCDLARTDDRFAGLDALLVLEELTAARANEKGGRAIGGDGKTGPARALARLALTCGALDYAQSEQETFDDAVERVRSNLLVTRSRLRGELRDYPGQGPPQT